MPSAIAAQARNDAARRAGARPLADSPFGPAFARGPIPSVGSNARLTYTPTAALRKQAQEGILQRLRAKNPPVAQQLASELAKHDFARVYAALVTPFGLRSDDAVDVVTAYTVLGYLIANGAPDPSPAAVRAVRSRVAGGLVSDPRVSRQRGALAEELKIMFVTLHSGWQSARREGSSAAYANSTAQLFNQQAGVDLRRVRLTDQGFVPR